MRLINAIMSMIKDIICKPVKNKREKPRSIKSEAAFLFVKNAIINNTSRTCIINKTIKIIILCCFLMLVVKANT